MAEEIKRRGGWPKGRARKTTEQVKAAGAETPAEREARILAAQMQRMALKMKSRPNWETNDFGADFGEDRLGISREKIDALAKDGVALQWATREVRGMEMRGEMRKMAAGGWTPVHVSDFDGIFDDGHFLPKGMDEVITVDDCMLVARPMGLHEKAKLGEKLLADERLQGPRQVLREGINATGGNHPSVRNQINVYEDRVEIPD